MTDMRDFGCKGGSCPKQERCQRFLDRENRDHSFYTPPFNIYNDGAKTEFRCGYQEIPPRQED
nr:hypothetical protein 7 [Gammaproteobacteria bacterium]